MNNFSLVGRLTTDPVLKDLEGGKKVVNIVVAISRPFKNQDGVYETDFIPVTLWQGVAESLSQYCIKGSQVAISGRVQMKTIYFQDKQIQSLEIIAEKVSFLSNPKSEEEAS